MISGRLLGGAGGCLRQIYENRLYKSRCGDWEQSCTEYLHTSRTHGQHILRLLNEFGLEYFELAHAYAGFADADIGRCVSYKLLSICTSSASQSAN